MTSAVWVVMALLGLAIVAVLVSKQAGTSGVLSSIGTELSCGIGTALSPVTGGAKCAPSVSSSISFG